MVYPDTIFFNPRYKLLLWPEGVKLNGRPWKVAGTKGWAFEFSFNLDRGKVRRLHGAQAALVPVRNAPQVGGGGGAPGGAPGGPGAMPGGPGMPGGEPGMPGGPPGGGPPGAPPGGPGMPPPP